MTGQSRSVNPRTSKWFNRLGRFQPREPHKHLWRGSQLHRSTLRAELPGVWNSCRSTCTGRELLDKRAGAWSYDKLLRALMRRFSTNERLRDSQMSETSIREPDEIWRACSRKLRQVEVSRHFQAILGCRLGEDWTTPRLVDMQNECQFIFSKNELTLMSVGGRVLLGRVCPWRPWNRATGLASVTRRPSFRQTSAR
jgi:hypothetical protein